MSNEATNLNEWDEAGKKTTSTTELHDLVRELKTQRTRYDDAKAHSNEEYRALGEIENRVVRVLMDSRLSNAKVEGVGTVSIVNKFVIQTPKTIETKRALYTYIEQKYGKDVADSKFGINSQTLTSFFNEEIEVSKDPAFVLPGIESPTIEQSLRFTKK